MAGRRWGVACVSLEITQRCNLDCTLCYLSEQSEAVRDLPLEELFRRIDVIRAQFGPGTDIQVSGGEPTLRRRDELVAVVRRIAQAGMRASLFTNGIRATRDLLEELSDAGLTDVAFHVDLTQQRKGFPSESALNELRAKYIERARGLPLSVFFNTTIFEQNLGEIPDIVRFLVTRSDVVRAASFQLQADTGRGVLGKRPGIVTVAAVEDGIQRGAAAPLDFDVFQIGHPACSRYSMAWVIGDRLHDAYADRAFVRHFMNRTAGVQIPRKTRGAAIRAIAFAMATRPDLWGPSLRWLVRSLWRVRRDLVAARGRIRKMSFFIHNFMDAAQLDAERVHACVFMAAGPDGPLSMCAYNARRDEYILKPIALADGTHWLPTVGFGVAYPLKLLKGRAREAARALRRRTA